MLKFATQYTMERDLVKPGTWRKSEQKDVTEGPTQKAVPGGKL